MVDISPKFTTNIDVSPSRSQVVLVLLVVGGIVFSFVGFYFLWNNKEYSWVPFLCSAIFVILAFVGWCLSRFSTDMDGGSPTQFFGPGGVGFATDSRSLLSPASMQSIERVMSMMIHRQPLPEGDGLVGKDGEPVPGMKRKANSHIQDINSSVDEMHRCIEEGLRLRAEGLSGAQDSSPPFSIGSTCQQGNQFDGDRE